MNAPSFQTLQAGAKTEGKAQVQCRPILEQDLPAVLDLLCEGFPRRSRAYWANGLGRLSSRHIPPGTERYGYAIDAAGAIVGCLLLISSEQDVEGRPTVRTNVSSWYVRPEFRFQASMLVSVVFRRKEVTFVNISPAPHTIPILQAQGYTLYVPGQAVTAPALRLAGPRSRTYRIGGKYRGPLVDELPEIELLRRHASWGCISLVCRDGDRLEPFVFARRRLVRTIIPAAQLVWCREPSSFVTFAKPLGRQLLRSGILLVSVDAEGRLDSVPGTYRPANGQKFFRGPDRPRLGDLADTELAIFGA